MSLWTHWMQAIWLLRPAFSRLRTFLWFLTTVVGITVRTDQLGATSIVRALQLNPKRYESVLAAFHSSAVKLDRLRGLWAHAVLKLFGSTVIVNGRYVLVGDGIKIAKEGRQMPGVKKLHQDSDSNTKAEWIMGHSLQAACILVNVAETVFAVPLTANIDEGIVWSNRSKKTLLDKMLALLASTQITAPYYLIADAYYASQKMVKGLLKGGNHLITRMKSNAVAYLPPPTQSAKKRGRPRLYGKKIKLKSLLGNINDMQKASICVYGDRNVEIRYQVRDLLWGSAGQLARFVVICHPFKGSIVLMCTDTSLDALEIVRLYGLRFKIEFSFKQAVRTIGTFAYHFWMAPMKPLKRNNGNQYMHRESEEYRAAVLRKLHAYHVFIHAGVVAQGLMQYLSATIPEKIWRHFGSWLRTVRDGVPPSELVVANALRQTLPEFLADAPDTDIFAKFVREKRGKTRKLNRTARLQMAA